MNTLVKPVVFVGLPRAVVYSAGLRAFTDDLGANPIETITNETGIWTLRFLAAHARHHAAAPADGLEPLIGSAACSGCSRSSTAALHFLTYIWLDQFFDWP